MAQRRKPAQRPRSPRRDIDWDGTATGQNSQPPSGLPPPPRQRPPQHYKLEPFEPDRPVRPPAKPPETPRRRRPEVTQTKRPRRRKLRWRWTAILFIIGVVASIFLLAQTNGQSTVEGFVENTAAGEGKPAPGAVPDQVKAAKGKEVKGRTTGGKVCVGSPCKTEKYTLVQAVVDNRDAFARCFPNGTYSGDLGDENHQHKKYTQDHTPESHDTYQGIKPKRGWVYAQDFGSRKNDSLSEFNQVEFARWVNVEIRAGRHKEIKYIISSAPENRGQTAFGISYRQGKTSFTHKNQTNHPNHVHVSYMMSAPGFPDMEHAHSTLILDFAHHMQQDFHVKLPAACK